MIVISVPILTLMTDVVIVLASVNREFIDKLTFDARTISATLIVTTVPIEARRRTPNKPPTAKKPGSNAEITVTSISRVTSDPRLTSYVPAKQW